MTLVPAVDFNATALESVDPERQEQMVTLYLSYARDQLAAALQLSGPETVAAVKAQIASVADATKNFGLSKEIQTDAVEMVRRAEFALGKAIRAGQERGEILTTGQHLRGPANQWGAAAIPDRDSSSVREFFPEGNASRQQIMNLSDGVNEPEFESALSDAKAEGNLSRANVARKLKGIKPEGMSPLERLMKIRDLAPTGMTSGQIAKELGITENRVRDVARENNIRVEADEVMRGTRRMKIDSQHIANHAVMTLEVLASGIAQINYDDLDVALLDDWATSLSKSLSALKRFATHIKEMAQ